jgi:arginyl-tRNA synthetase
VTPEELSVAIRGVLDAAVDGGQVRLAREDVPSDVAVERPRQREHGDWATNIAMQLAKKAGLPPRRLAEILAAGLRERPGVQSVDVAGPGFLNVRLETAAAGELARSIVLAGSSYGRGETNTGLRVNLEFVSANPTGPVHLGSTRWAAVGDALARLLTATGADVTREYYFNDAGGQIDRFVQSLMARARGEQPPADGYGGAYITEVAEAVLKTCAEDGVDALALPEPQAFEVFRRIGVARMFDEIKASLHGFGVDFDVFFHEDSLHTSGAVGHAVDRLRELGRIDDRDGAVWLRTTDFGDDKDRVILKSDGAPSYFAADIAYYLDKR